MKDYFFFNGTDKRLRELGLLSLEKGSLERDLTAIS